MTLLSRLGLSGPNAILVAGAGILLIVIGAIFIWPPSGPEGDADDQAAPLLSEAAPSQNATVEETPEAAPAEGVTQTAPEESVTEEAPVEEAEAAAETKPESPAPQGPVFDVVRIDPNGESLVAGNTTPGARIRLLVDGEQIVETVSDGRGQFVALFDMAPSENPRSLSAEMVMKDGTVVPSSGTVLIAPVRPVQVAEPEAAPTVVEEESVAAVEPEAEDATTAVEPEVIVEAEEFTEPEVIAEPEAVATIETPETTEQEDVAETAVTTDAEVVAEAEVPAVVVEDPEPVVTAKVEQTAPEAPQADSPAIVLADDSGIKLLQPTPQPQAPPEAGPDVTTNVVIDTITYDAEGEVALAGRGASERFVRVYLNDEPIKTVSIAPDGSWHAPLPEVDAGVYRLRVDEVSEDGAVTSRVETPFQREETELLAGSDQKATAVIVQPGFTLWAIARDRFGSGEQYVRVYEANRDLIRDPDLIYPGQVFALPDG